jgi:CDP-glycerol glycerophosphotransferase
LKKIKGNLISISRETLVFVVGIVNYLIPKTPMFLISTCPDLESQGVSILRWLAVNHRNAKVVLLIDKNPELVAEQLKKLLWNCNNLPKIVLRSSIAGVWSFLRSNIVFYTHILYGSRLPSPESQAVINLWHGVALKGIWRNDPACSRRWNSGVPWATKIVSCSDVVTHIFQVSSGYAKDRFIESGLPRNDSILLAKTNCSFIKESIAANKYIKIIFYLPTFRQPRWEFRPGVDGVESVNVLNLPNAAILQLNQMLLENNSALYVKPHFASKHYGNSKEKWSNIRIITDDWLHNRGVTLYDTLGVSDVLVTDISSVYVDYMILDRPIIFYFPDQHEYQKSRGFVFERIEDWIPGPIISSPYVLVSEIQAALAGSDNYGELRRTLKQKLNYQTAPDAIENLFACL